MILYKLCVVPTHGAGHLKPISDNIDADCDLKAPSRGLGRAAWGAPLMVLPRLRAASDGQRACWGCPFVRCVSV